MKRSKYELDEYPDACDFLAKTVIEPDDIGPIGFIQGGLLAALFGKPRIRVKAISVPHDPNSED